jgi:hypothetical protein
MVTPEGKICAAIIAVNESGDVIKYFTKSKSIINSTSGVYKVNNLDLVIHDWNNRKKEELMSFIIRKELHKK